MCGTDTINYYRIYYFNTLLQDERLEPLFLLVRMIMPSFQLFLAFFSIITYGIIGWIISKNVKYKCLGVLIFMISATKFFPESFNIVRQSVATSFILWSFVRFNNKKYWSSVILLVIASLFHYSSGIALLFFSVKKYNPGFKFVIVVLISTFFIGLFNISATALQQIIIKLGEFTSNPLLLAYSRYGYKSNLLMAFTSRLVWLLPLTLLALTTYPSSLIAKKKYGFYYSIFFIATVIGNLIIPALDSGLRLVFSINIIQLLVVPMAYQYYSTVQKSILLGVLIFSSALYVFYLYSLTTSPITSIVPYTMFS